MTPSTHYQRMAKERVRKWQESPLAFVEDCIDVTPSDQQAAALAAFPTTKRMSIRSGHGTGKDACASWIILWFLSTRTYPKVVCTAPTARQLSDILWSELSKWLRKSILVDEFVIQKDKMFHPHSPKEWWCRAVSPSVKSSKEEQAETLAGFHGDHLLIIADEASGIPDPVYIPLEGALTQEDNRVLLIGNMTRNQGYFYDTHFHADIRQNWVRLHWDSRDSSNVDPEYPKYMAMKYGEQTNVFRIRVVGDPPLEDERMLIPLSWAMKCIGNQIETGSEELIFLGVDVARYGEDFSIILPRKGLQIYPWKQFQGMDTTRLGDEVILTFRDNECSGAGIDEIGVGGGVIDYIRRQDFGRQICRPVNVTAGASRKEKWHRLRDELWWMARENCRLMRYSFPSGTREQERLSNELCNELASVSYDFTGTGAIKVESKDVLKARGVASPNIADALCISEHFYRSAHRIWGKGVSKQKTKKPWEQERKTLGKHGWMAA